MRFIAQSSVKVDAQVHGDNILEEYTMSILSVYALLKVVGYYDLSFLSMSLSVMGFKKKKLGWWVGGWGELYPNVFLIFGIFLTLKNP